jgi:CHRD domain
MRIISLLCGSLGVITALAAPAMALDFVAHLDGFQQVPSVFTTGHGTFEASGQTGEQQLNYTLTYADLSAPTVAHIHFGKASTNGGVLVFLCSGGNKPACPPSGTVEGTITPSDVQAIAAQGVTAGDFNALLAALVSQSAYVNVHTPDVPDGEIRGQIVPRGQN